MIRHIVACCDRGELDDWYNKFVRTDDLPQSINPGWEGWLDWEWTP